MYILAPPPNPKDYCIFLDCGSLGHIDALGRLTLLGLGSFLTSAWLSSFRLGKLGPSVASVSIITIHLQLIAIDVVLFAEVVVAVGVMVLGPGAHTVPAVVLKMQFVTAKVVHHRVVIACPHASTWMLVDTPTDKKLSTAIHV